MMRAMYAGVSGLKTHQTKMDVIGNNIANVNTVAFKSSMTTFSEVMYQNLSSASGATADGRGGVNAKQIGLGVATGSTSINITSPGATQTTGDAFDLAITGDSFFIVNNGVDNLFTKAGAFYVDGTGNLAMKSTGYNVMGWQADDTGMIKKDEVSPLRIMQEKNLTSPPEATEKGTCLGILDKNSAQVNSDMGYIMNLNFYDALGYSYTAKFSVRSTDEAGEYTVELTDILDSNGISIVDTYNATELADIVKFGNQNIQTEVKKYELLPGVRYDDTAKKYYRKATFPDITSDYEEKKVPGFLYDANKFTVNGTTVTAEGAMELSAEELEDIYGVVYVTSDANGNPVQPYYYKEDHITGNGYIIDSPDKWVEALGIDTSTVKNFAVNVENDGTATFTFEQDFTLIEGAVADGTGFYDIEVEQEDAYGIDTSDPTKTYKFDVAPNGVAQVTINTVISANVLKFNTDTGVFSSINGADTVMLNFADSVKDKLGGMSSLKNFSDIEIDFTQTKWFDNGGSSTMGLDSGDIDGVTGKGKKLGDLIGLSVSSDGIVWGSYDNGNTAVLGQIAVANFPNPAGLEKVGENCYQTTLNSGDFDGIGQEIIGNGGKMTSGVLEMSNVDLSTEFTEMITTQRGFQANSRIITTSDTLLEELINLKR